MNITRNVIQDLLPLYASGEASPDTVALVEKYLETDPTLAGMAKDMAAAGMSKVPLPDHKELEMEAYRKANTIMMVRTLGLAVIIAGAFLCTLLIVPLVYRFLAG